MKWKGFVFTTLIGGITILVPILILMGIFSVIVSVVAKFLGPLMDLMTLPTLIAGMIADLIAIALLIAVCFFLGLAVRTRLGTIFHGLIEKEVLERIPGYSTTWIGNLEENSKLALVRPFDNNTLVTGFITDKNDDETYTVFVPTGPNPTSGTIYHVEKDRVYFVSVPVDVGMKSVTSCGVGSEDLIRKYKRKHKNSKASSA